MRKQRLPRLTALFAAILVAGFVATTLPSSASGDELLARDIREGDVRFKVTCNFDHAANDDPIVFPTQPGASHLHNYFGKTGVDSNTTTFSDLVDGDDRTTCNDAADLASYWAPALETSDQGFVEPARMTAYYRRGSKNGLITPYPDGLKIIAGWEFGKPTPSVDIAGWQCGDSSAIHFRQPAPPDDCGTDHLHAYIRYQECWNGRDLDSADHRSHMAYATWNAVASANVCPLTHPFQVPQLTTYINYTTVSLGTTVIGLASGPVQTLHADFFNGWERARLIERIETCLNGLLRCESGGGSGEEVPGDDVPTDPDDRPRDRPRDRDRDRDRPRDRDRVRNVGASTTSLVEAHQAVRGASTPLVSCSTPLAEPVAVPPATVRA